MVDFTAFRQGTVTEGGNCASIALIKAAMNKYGLEGVFKEHKFDGSTHSVKLQDGQPLSFTDDDIQKAASRADFHLRAGDTAAQTEENKQILKQAHLYFCAMVMRVIQIAEAGEGVGDFDDAIRALNDGAITREIPILLGLPFKVGPACAHE